MPAYKPDELLMVRHDALQRTINPRGVELDVLLRKHDYGQVARRVAAEIRREQLLVDEQIVDEQNKKLSRKSA